MPRRRALALQHFLRRSAQVRPVASALREVKLHPARHVDRHAGDEIRVLRGEEADHARLVDRLGHAPQRRALDLLRLLRLAALLPVRPDALGERDAGAIALTLMPSGPSSSASLRVNAMMPPLAAA